MQPGDRPIDVRMVETGAGDVCRNILATLPTWFGIAEANEGYARVADSQPTFVASIDGKAVGLLTIVTHSPAAAEIHLVAVRPEHHGRGIGSRLLAAAEDLLARTEVEFLQVKTLSAKDPDEGYAATRAFYRQRGFRVLEEFPELWDPSNPAVQMVKSIGPSLGARERVAALIVRERRVLMVRERGIGAEGRHDGAVYWTLPGGGRHTGESAEDAVIREVREEVGLVARRPRLAFHYPYVSGWTACYAVDTDGDDEPVMGVEDLACDCPRIVGLDWMPIGTADVTAVPTMFLSVDVD